MDPKQQVIDAGIRMLKNGITIGAWGNVSSGTRRAGSSISLPAVWLMIPW